MLDLLVLEKSPFSFKNLDNQGIGLPDRFPDDFFRQHSGRRISWEESARMVDRTINRQAVALADDEIFLAVSRSSVYRAGALFKRDVIAEDAERLPLHKRMLKHGAFKLGAGEARKHGFLPTQLFAQLVEQAFSDNHYALWRIDRDVFEFRMKADRQVGRHGPGGGRPDDRVYVFACQCRIDESRVGLQLEPHIDRGA